MDLIYLILNYKTYHNTIEVCNDILSFEISYKYQIVIVDNNSPNESYNELIKAFGKNKTIDIIRSEVNGGYAKGNNVGLKYMEKYNPRYVCIINNDVKFDCQTIEKLLEAYSKLERPAIIAPIQFQSNNRLAPLSGIEKIPSFWDEMRSYSIFNSLPTINYNKGHGPYGAQQVDIIPGAMFLIKYDTFSQIHFFDEDTFLFGEEKLLARKIKDLGLNNYIITSLKYEHLHSTTINSEKSDFKQRLLILRGKMIYISKYHKFYMIKKCMLFLAFYYNYFFYRYPKRLISRINK